MDQHKPGSDNSPQQLFSLIFSKVITQGLGAVAELNVADLLQNGSRPIAELASECGAHEESLYRVLRMLAGYGVFAETAPREFELTPLAQLLVSDSPKSLREFAIFVADPIHNGAYAQSLHSVRTGETAFKHAHGAEIFDYFTTDPEFFSVLNNAMSSNSRRLKGAISSAYDFSRFETLADVGGGLGHLLMEVLGTNPHLHGKLFDLPEVVEDAAAEIAAAGMADRIELTGGSFFDAVPVQSDAYMMKHIIHDWDDERSITILRNCAENMSPDGRILVIEYVVPEGNEPDISKLLDIEMLLLPGGRERTRAQFEALFSAAGLRLNDVIVTDAAICIVEGVRA